MLKNPLSFVFTQIKKPVGKRPRHLHQPRDLDRRAVEGACIFGAEKSVFFCFNRLSTASLLLLQFILKTDGLDTAAFITIETLCPLSCAGRGLLSHDDRHFLQALPGWHLLRQLIGHFQPSVPVCYAHAGHRIQLLARGVYSSNSLAFQLLLRNEKQR